MVSACTLLSVTARRTCVAEKLFSAVAVRLPSCVVVSDRAASYPSPAARSHSAHRSATSSGWRFACRAGRQRVHLRCRQRPDLRRAPALQLSRWTGPRCSRCLAQETCVRAKDWPALPTDCRLQPVSARPPAPSSGSECSTPAMPPVVSALSWVASSACVSEVESPVSCAEVRARQPGPYSSFAARSSLRRHLAGCRAKRFAWLSDCRSATPTDRRPLSTPMPCTCVVVRLATFIAWKAAGACVAIASSCAAVKP